MAAYPLRAAFAGILLFVIGLGLASAAFQINRKEQDRREGWLRADGTVVELLKRRTFEGDKPVPLVAFTSDRTKMGEFTNTRTLKYVGYTVAVIIAALNVWLLVQTLHPR